ncbi:biopolymer transporter ExbD [Roseovarius spongiae]|uniref:Biopolymer transporter ExbD n=2 Tax=Roseovarius spongiae TaxID=2320272 RepID=A0A3A8B6L6_9RHOB|nr:biopolymer transporter ExbD [Roseovarius spongiae]
MTSLIDVIFLLLLFFMLSSTFSKFAEVELSAATGGAAITSEVRPLFLQLGAADLRLNGEPLPLDALAQRLREGGAAGEVRPLLISLRDGVTSQRLTDLLVALRGVPGVAPTVLGDA